MTWIAFLEAIDTYCKKPDEVCIMSSFGHKDDYIYVGAPISDAAGIPVAITHLADPALSDSRRVPSNFRTLPSNVQIGDAYADLMDAFGWKQATMVVDAQTTGFRDDLSLSRLVTSGKYTIKPVLYSSDVDLGVLADEVRRLESRIVILATGLTPGLTLLVEMRRLYGRDAYQFMLPPGALFQGTAEVFAARTGIPIDEWDNLVGFAAFDDVQTDPDLSRFVDDYVHWFRSTGRETRSASHMPSDIAARIRITAKPRYSSPNSNSTLPRSFSSCW